MKVYNVYLYNDGRFSAPTEIEVASNENKATTINIDIPDKLLSEYTSHYIEIKSPRGVCTSTRALEPNQGKISIAITNDIFSTRGRYQLSYTARNIEANQVFKSIESFTIEVLDAINASEYYDENTGKYDYITAVTTELADLREDTTEGLATKADKDTTYTKTEVNTKVDAVNAKADTNTSDIDGLRDDVDELKSGVRVYADDSTVNIGAGKGLVNIGKRGELYVEEGVAKYNTQTREYDIVDNELANKRYVDYRVSQLIDGAPEALDTLKELADAIGENTSLGEAIQALVNSHITASDNAHSDIRNILNGVKSVVDTILPVTNQWEVDHYGDTPKRMLRLYHIDEDARVNIGEDGIDIFLWDKNLRIDLTGEWENQGEADITVASFTLHLIQAWRDWCTFKIIDDCTGEVLVEVKEDGLFTKGRKVLTTTDLNTLSNNISQKANSSDVYTKTEVDRKFTDLINNAPETLDTLKELADAIGANTTLAEAINSLVSSHVASSEASHAEINGKLQAIEQQIAQAPSLNFTDEGGVLKYKGQELALKKDIDKTADSSLFEGASPIFGVKFYGDNPDGERTDDAIGFIVNYGVDDEVVRNDFDKVVKAYGLFERIEDIDAGGNTNYFVKVRKHYYQEVYGTDSIGDYVSMRFSFTHQQGFGVPLAFIREDGTERDYIYLGCYKATVDLNGRLGSRPTTITHNSDDTYTIENYLCSHMNIQDMADRADNNGYELETYAEYVCWSNLMTIITATRDDQSANQGVTSVVSVYPYYKNTAQSALATDNMPANTGLTVYVTGDRTVDYIVGDVIGIVNTSNSQMLGRRVLVSSTYSTEGNYTELVLGKQNTTDTGFEWTTNHRLLPHTYLSGTTDNVVASIGSEVSRTDAKHHFVQYGREDHYGTLYENCACAFKTTDKLYISKASNRKTATRVSNMTTSSSLYECAIDSGVATKEGWIKTKVQSSTYPGLTIASTVGASSNKAYCDYTWANANTGPYLVLYGGDYDNGSLAGSSFAGLGAGLWSALCWVGCRTSATSKLGG